VGSTLVLLLVRAAGRLRRDDRACYTISCSHTIRKSPRIGLLKQRNYGKNTKGGEKNLMQINLCIKAKLAGTDEGKILDDIHGVGNV
jgi:hypothetical protein